jgi:hypothetical protein
LILFSLKSCNLNLYITIFCLSLLWN